MEAVGLTYDSTLHAIICLEHGYCLPGPGAKRHLKVLYEIQGSRLKAACEELEALESNELRTLQIPSGRAPIAFITIEGGFQCAAPACNLRCAIP